MTLHEQHMKLIDGVNNAENEVQRTFRSQHLHGWLEGVGACGRNVGQMIMEADMEQFERGNDRPMCGGVFLD